MIFVIRLQILPNLVTFATRFCTNSTRFGNENSLNLVTLPLMPLSLVLQRQLMGNDGQRGGKIETKPAKRVIRFSEF